MVEFVYVSMNSVSGIIFYDFVANSVRKFFPTDQLTPTSQILSLFGICWRSRFIYL